jgi:3-oxoacyl-[acyl-carrier protein] reductase
VTAADTAIITGAAGAIGSAVSLRLAQDGWRLLLVDVAPLDEVAFSLRAARATVTACIADIRTPDGIDEIASAAGAAGHVALLVNNAGITRDGRATMMDEGRFREVVAVDLVAPLRLCDRLAAMLTGGSVVNMASRAAFGNFGQANYVAAKAGLIGATRSLALHLAPHVRVNAVAPGLISTPMTASMPRDVLERLIQRVPAGRPGTKDDVADAVAFLARATYITGQVLSVCGGRGIGDRGPV